MNGTLAGIRRWAATLLLLAAGVVMTGCGKEASRAPVAPDEQVHSSLDVPLRVLREETEKYVGTVFEDQFKFYRIYHDKEDADPALRGQVILGETHFTARPVTQPLDMIQVEITPAQEAWIRDRGIERQDALRLRVRFKGIAPGSALAFELLEVLEEPTRRMQP